MLPFDATVKQNENSKSIVYSLLKIQRFIKYKPSQKHSAAFNSGAMERIIRMVDKPGDLLDPPKFKHKRVPKGNGSSPVHSPSRPVTVKDQKDWKIPPCISTWKNAKGYTIPLDKRFGTRGLQQLQININFSQLSEALYVAEQHAREVVSMRSKVQKEIVMKEKERKEQELHALAQKERSERNGKDAAMGKKMRKETVRIAMGKKKRKIIRDWDRGEKSGPRDRLVVFEREVAEDADMFGLDQFITQLGLKRGVKSGGILNYVKL